MKLAQGIKVYPFEREIVYNNKNKEDIDVENRYFIRLIMEDNIEEDVYWDIPVGEIEDFINNLRECLRVLK